MLSRQWQEVKFMVNFSTFSQNCGLYIHFCSPKSLNLKKFPKLYGRVHFLVRERERKLFLSLCLIGRWCRSNCRGYHCCFLAPSPALEDCQRAQIGFSFPPLPNPLKPAIAMGKHWDIFTIVIQFVLHRFLFTIRGYTQPIFLASGQ